MEKSENCFEWNADNGEKSGCLFVHAKCGVESDEKQDVNSREDSTKVKARMSKKNNMLLLRDHAAFLFRACKIRTVLQGAKLAQRVTILTAQPLENRASSVCRETLDFVVLLSYFEQMTRALEDHFTPSRNLKVQSFSASLPLHPKSSPASKLVLGYHVESLRISLQVRNSHSALLGKSQANCASL